MSIKNSLILTKRYKILVSSIHSVYRLINSTYDPKDLIVRLARLICQVLNAQYCMVMLLDSSKQYFVLRSLVSPRKKMVFDNKIKVTNRSYKNVIKLSRSLRSKHIMCVPLIAEDIIGIVCLRRKTTEPHFDIFDQEILMSICEESVIGIKNLQLYKEQEKIVLGSIKSLVTLLDTRVPQEYTHSPYFSRLVTAIAQQMHLDESQIQSLQYASMLHDAGKADIPLEILTKTTKLTSRELQIIKYHPIKGAEILRHLQILKPAIPIIMHHHEKFNGTGYPSRLKKGQIPLGARIMAVADAFEAMVYGRPYRERMSIVDALKEIKKKSGTQFDPKIVDAFLRCVKKLRLKKYLRYNTK